MESLERALEQVVAAGQIASASLCVRVDGEARFHQTIGCARRDPPKKSAFDQPYDLASVTKALAGSAVAASLVQSGALALDVRVAAYLDVDPRITLRQLLQHTSGYPACAPLYQQVQGAWGTAAARQTVLDAARTTPLEAPPGAQHRYSDLGFLVLLQLLEAVGGPLDRQFHEKILVPAGVHDLRWGWPEAAATEDCPVRGHVVQGTVHDLNCAAMGGVSTHAGLFGTAAAVAGLAEAFLDATRGIDNGLPGEALARFWAEKGLGSHRCGWDGISPGYSSTGQFFPPDTVGHLGYTGTTVWIAPSRRTVVALLTNRVHPVDDKAPIRAARPVIHDAVARALGWDRNTS